MCKRENLHCGFSGLCPTQNKLLCGKDVVSLLKNVYLSLDKTGELCPLGRNERTLCLIASGVYTRDKIVKSFKSQISSTDVVATQTQRHCLPETVSFFCGPNNKI